MRPVNYLREATPWAFTALLLLFGCGGAMDSEFANAADASGGTGTTADASGGTGTTNDARGVATASGGASSEAASEKPIPILDGCSAVTLPCEPVPGTDERVDWSYTFASIASRCGASCLHVELATNGNCITQVMLLHEPFPRDAGFTLESIASCVAQTLVGRRWECVPRDRWSEFSWNACVLM